MKQTLLQAGYKYVRCLSPKEHLLLNEDGKGEVWAANKGHAGYGLRWNRTDLEFCRSFPGKVEIPN